jgi:hypothetical protein
MSRRFSQQSSCANGSVLDAEDRTTYDKHWDDLHKKLVQETSIPASVVESASQSSKQDTDVYEAVAEAKSSSKKKKK